MNNDLRKSFKLLVVVSIALGNVDVALGLLGATHMVILGILVVLAAVGCMKRLKALWYIGIFAAAANLVLSLLPVVPIPWGLIPLILSFAVIYMLLKPEIKEFMRGHAIDSGKGPAVSGKDPGCFACEYVSGGGMAGGYTRFYLESRQPGTATMEYKRTRYNGDETKEGVVPVPDKTVGDLKRLFYGYGIRGWVLKKSDLVALDAPSVSVDF